MKKVCIAVLRTVGQFPSYTVYARDIIALPVCVHHGSKCSQAANVEVFLLVGVAHAESIIYFSELAVVEWARWLAPRWSMRSCVYAVFFFYPAPTRLAWCGDALKMFQKKKGKKRKKGARGLISYLLICLQFFPSCIKTWTKRKKKALNAVHQTRQLRTCIPGLFSDW